WPDNASDGARRWKAKRSEGIHTPVRRKRVQVLVAGTGIEEHHTIAIIQKFALQKLLVGGEGSASLGAGENALSRSHFFDRIHDGVVANGNRRAAALAHDIQDDEVAIGFGNSETCCQRVRVRPHFRSSLAFM